MRDGSWIIPFKFIEDTTKSGKSKRRYANTNARRTFQCSLYFTLSEYEKFITWFNNDLKGGSLSFGLPQIDAKDGQMLAYVFSGNGGISVNNPDGDVLKVSFTLEEL